MLINGTHLGFFQSYSDLRKGDTLSRGWGVGVVANVDELSLVLNYKVREL